MKLLYTFLFLMLFTLQSTAQNLKGRVTDTTGEALYGSTVYIKESNQGLVCNEEGHYQATLRPGNYTLEYKCLGFKSVNKKIQIALNDTTTLNVSLEESPFTLKEVTVSSQEDPAYPIMRKAIEKAPLYAGAINEYKADVYIKVNAELLKVSSLINSLAKKGEGIKLSELTNQVFVQESFNEIQFTSPDKYKQTVKAFSSSIPDDMDSKDAMGILKSSLYAPKVGMCVSPLNPKAFSYYKFRYEGFTEENGITINKIKIERKVKDPILFEGYIYIADNTWHIHSAELNSYPPGAKQGYTITFQELGTNTYLPITYSMTVDVSLLGFEATTNYFASLTYTDIKVNDKIIKELEDKKKPKKRQFEIIQRDSLYTTTADSLASKRDSVYWAKVRAIPLEKRELTSFIKKDSIQFHLDSVRKEHHNPKFSFTDIISGGQIGGDSSKVVFKYDGLILGVRDYNFVDGLWLGQKFNIESKLGKYNKLEISPYLYYAFSRKRLLGGADVNVSYAPLRQGKLSISGGSISEDYNPDGILRFNNFTSSLIRGKNYNFFYQKDFINITNEIDIANGLKLTTGLEAAKRSGLSNNTDYTWGRKSKIRPNIFPNDRFDHTAYNIGIDYTPYAYYTIRNGVKKYVKYTSPTFYMRYNEAFSGWQTNNSKYRKIRLGLQQSIKLSEFSNISYLAEGGAFIGNKDKIHFADFQHFNTSDVMINLKSPFRSFMLLDNYIASTNKHWIRTNINYNSNYVLLKYLPFLQGKIFTESLHLKNLYTPDMKLYTETGYSVNFMESLSLGIFASFKGTKYQDFGIRILLDLEKIKKQY
ncbi:carboxypeptidase-like regulatory domain-containing protein [Dysgonomonas sp. Marseille-P4677]|uniref:DUF5686 and carboxypeptidase regulatory-like domain-containing protein n=1 Tax=Dysgonomonas sp. Marseille-P4677 TaxID=2364790 RepID=UPI001911D19A|nr:DUF5686 and carboxypeptidase regulatory-like domain-containing protein [Dysgonomonas sp. Marseille-P4677]MBK5721528.1 carboxypeptidase-like regulatory domain-containing protein [Dysgonomonas sp. Marseille-P4677]